MREEGIVIKKIPLREFDELLICYTREHGKQAFQLKSSLRHTSKQGRHLDILHYVDFTIVEGHVMPIIVSARSLNPFFALRTNISSWALASFVLECVDRLIPDSQPDSEVWSGLFSLLEGCDTARVPQASILDIQYNLQKKVLELLGYPPSMNIEEIAQAQFNSIAFIRLCYNKTVHSSEYTVVSS